VKKGVFKKSVAMLLIALQLAGLMPSDAQAAEKRSISQALLIPVDALQVSAELGRVQTRVAGKLPKTLLVIEDAHAVPAAQKSIWQLIDNLSGQYGSFPLLLEGLTDTPDLALEHSFPDRDWLLSQIESDVQAQNISGAAAALLLSSQLNARSAESKELYIQAVRLYQDAQRQQMAVLEKLARARDIITKSKEKVYPRGALKWNRLIEQDSLDGLKVVLESGQKEIFENYKHLQSTHELVRRQQFLKRPAVIYFWGRFLFKLEQRAESASQRQSLAALKEEFRLNQASIPDSAEKLEGLLSAEEVLTTTNLERRLYLFALRAAEDWRAIDAAALAEEYQAFLIKKTESFLTKSAQRLLLKQTLRVQLLEKLVRLELSHADWKIVQKMSLENPVWAVFKDFYSIQHDRERMMAKQIEKSFQTSSSTVFVSGGFHRMGLEKIARDQGWGFAVITPAVKTLEGAERYADLMHGQVGWRSEMKNERGNVDLQKAYWNYLVRRYAKEKPEQVYDLLLQWRKQLVLHLADLKQLDLAVEAAAPIHRWLTEFMPDLFKKKFHTEWLNHLTPGANILSPAMTQSPFLLPFGFIPLDLLAQPLDGKRRNIEFRLPVTGEDLSAQRLGHRMLPDASEDVPARFDSEINFAADYQLLRSTSGVDWGKSAEARQQRQAGHALFQRLSVIQNLFEKRNYLGFIEVLLTAPDFLGDAVLDFHPSGGSYRDFYAAQILRGLNQAENLLQHTESDPAQVKNAVTFLEMLDQDTALEFVEFSAPAQNLLKARPEWRLIVSEPNPTLVAERLKDFFEKAQHESSEQKEKRLRDILLSPLIHPDTAGILRSLLWEELLASMQNGKGGDAADFFRLLARLLFPMEMPAEILSVNNLITVPYSIIEGVYQDDLKGVLEGFLSGLRGEDQYALGYAAIHRYVEDFDFLTRLAFEIEEIDVRFRIYAVGLLASRHPIRFSSYIQSNGLQFERLMRDSGLFVEGIGNQSNDDLKNLFSRSFATESLKALQIAVFFSMMQRDIASVSQESIIRIISTVMLDGGILWGAENAYSNQKIGNRLVAKLKSFQAVFMVMAHEFGHLILEYEHQFESDALGLPSKAGHELGADLFALAYAEKMRWDVRPYLEFADAEKDFHFFRNHGTSPSRSGHREARVIIHQIYEFLSWFFQTQSYARDLADIVGWKMRLRVFLSFIDSFKSGRISFFDLAGNIFFRLFKNTDFESPIDPHDPVIPNIQPTGFFVDPSSSFLRRRSEARKKNKTDKPVPEMGEREFDVALSDRLKKGLGYEEALEWYRAYRDSGISFPRGFWERKETAANYTLAVLDENVPGFKVAREKNNLKEMATLYLKHVKGYQSREMDLSRDPPRPQKTGQQIFFYEIGGMKTLMSIRRDYLTKMGSPASLLRIAIPKLIDVRNPDALDPLNVESKYWTQSTNRIYHILLLFDAIPGFREARASKDVKKMREIYEKEVASYVSQDKRYPNGPLSYYREVGGLRGIFKQLPRISPYEVLSEALPELVDPKNPDAYRRDEITIGHWNDEVYVRERIAAVFDQIPGFLAAREKDDIAGMARIFRERVIAYKSPQRSNDGKLKTGGMDVFFTDHGLGGSLNHPRDFLGGKRSSPSALIKFVYPKLISESNPDAIHPSEIERGYWDDVRNVKKAALRALFRLDGFFAAYRRRDVPRMAEIIKKINGLRNFFAENARLDTPMQLPHPYWENGATGDAWQVLKIAVPGLTDSAVSGSLKREDVMLFRWIEEEARLKLLDLLDSIPGFAIARKQYADDESTRQQTLKTMADLYRLHVLSLKGDLGVRGGQSQFFTSVNELMSGNYSFMPAGRGPRRLLDFVIPGLVDENNPNALHPIELTNRARLDKADLALLFASPGSVSTRKFDVMPGDFPAVTDQDSSAARERSEARLNDEDRELLAYSAGQINQARALLPQIATMLKTAKRKNFDVADLEKQKPWDFEETLVNLASSNRMMREAVRQFYEIYSKVEPRPARSEMRVVLTFGLSNGEPVIQLSLKQPQIDLIKKWLEGYYPEDYQAELVFEDKNRLQYRLDGQAHKVQPGDVVIFKPKRGTVKKFEDRDIHLTGSYVFRVETDSFSYWGEKRGSLVRMQNKAQMNLGWWSQAELSKAGVDDISQYRQAFHIDMSVLDQNGKKAPNSLRDSIILSPDLFDFFIIKKTSRSEARKDISQPEIGDDFGKALEGNVHTALSWLQRHPDVYQNWKDKMGLFVRHFSRRGNSLDRRSVALEIMELFEKAYLLTEHRSHGKALGPAEQQIKVTFAFNVERSAVEVLGAARLDPEGKVYHHGDLFDELHIDLDRDNLLKPMILGTFVGAAPASYAGEIDIAFMGDEFSAERRRVLAILLLDGGIPKDKKLKLNINGNPQKDVRTLKDLYPRRESLLNHPNLGPRIREELAGKSAEFISIYRQKLKLPQHDKIGLKSWLRDDDKFALGVNEAAKNVLSKNKYRPLLRYEIKQFRKALRSLNANYYAAKEVPFYLELRKYYGLSTVPDELQTQNPGLYAAALREGYEWKNNVWGRSEARVNTDAVSVEIRPLQKGQSVSDVLSRSRNFADLMESAYGTGNGSVFELKRINLNDPNTVVVAAANSQNKLVGYFVASPFKSVSRKTFLSPGLTSQDLGGVPEKKAYYVHSTVIHPDYQQSTLLWKMWNLFRTELNRRGVTHVLMHVEKGGRVEKAWLARGAVVVESDQSSGKTNLLRMPINRHARSEARRFDLKLTVKRLMRTSTGNTGLPSIQDMEALAELEKARVLRFGSGSDEAKMFILEEMGISSIQYAMASAFAGGMYFGTVWHESFIRWIAQGREISSKKAAKILGLTPPLVGIVILEGFSEEAYLDAEYLNRQLMLAEILHLLEGSFIDHPLWDTRKPQQLMVAKETINALLQLLFLNEDELDEFYSAHAEWTLAQRRALYQRYRSKPKLNPASDIPSVLKILREDILNQNKVSSRSSKTVFEVLMGDQARKRGQLGALKKYLQILRERERFSDYQSIFPAIVKRSEVRSDHTTSEVATVRPRGDDELIGKQISKNQFYRKVTIGTVVWGLLEVASWYFGFPFIFSLYSWINTFYWGNFALGSLITSGLIASATGAIADYYTQLISDYPAYLYHVKKRFAAFMGVRFLTGVVAFIANIYLIDLFAAPLLRAVLSGAVGVSLSSLVSVYFNGYWNRRGVEEMKARGDASPEKIDELQAAYSVRSQWGKDLKGVWGRLPVLLTQHHIAQDIVPEYLRIPTIFVLGLFMQLFRNYMVNSQKPSFDLKTYLKVNLSVVGLIFILGGASALSIVFASIALIGITIGYFAVTAQTKEVSDKQPLQAQMSESVPDIKSRLFSTEESQSFFQKLLKELKRRGLAMARDGSDIPLDHEDVLHTNTRVFIWDRGADISGKRSYNRFYRWNRRDNAGGIILFGDQDVPILGYVVFNRIGEKSFQLRFQVFESEAGMPGYRGQGHGRRLVDFLKIYFSQYFNPKPNELFFYLSDGEARQSSALTASLIKLGFELTEDPQRLILKLNRSEMRLVPATFDLKRIIPADKQNKKVRVVFISDNTGTLTEHHGEPMLSQISSGLEKVLEDPRNAVIVNSGDPKKKLEQAHAGVMRAVYGKDPQTPYYFVWDGGAAAGRAADNGQIFQLYRTEDWPESMRVEFAKMLAHAFFDALLDEIKKEVRQADLAGLDKEKVESLRQEALAAIETKRRSGDWSRIGPDGKNLVLNLWPEKWGEGAFIYDSGSKMAIDLVLPNKANGFGGSRFFREIEKNYRRALGESLFSGQQVQTFAGSNFFDISILSKVQTVERVVETRILPTVQEDEIILFVIIGDGANDIPTMTEAGRLQRMIPGSAVLPVYLSHEEGFASDLPVDGFVSPKEKLQGTIPVLNFANAVSGKKVSETGVLSLLQWRSEMRPNKVLFLIELESLLLRSSAFPQDVKISVLRQPDNLSVTGIYQRETRTAKIEFTWHPEEMKWKFRLIAEEKHEALTTAVITQTDWISTSTDWAEAQAQVTGEFHLIVARANHILYPDDRERIAASFAAGAGIDQFRLDTSFSEIEKTAESDPKKAFEQRIAALKAVNSNMKERYDAALAELIPRAAEEAILFGGDGWPKLTKGDFIYKRSQILPGEMAQRVFVFVKAFTKGDWIHEEAFKNLPNGKYVLFKDLSQEGLVYIIPLDVFKRQSEIGYQVKLVPYQAPVTAVILDLNTAAIEILKQKGVKTVSIPGAAEMPFEGVGEQVLGYMLAETGKTYEISLTGTHAVIQPAAQRSEMRNINLSADDKWFFDLLRDISKPIFAQKYSILLGGRPSIWKKTRAGIFVPSPMDEVILALKPIVTSEHDFIDLGSGLNTALIVATHLGVHKAVGIEGDESLFVDGKAVLDRFTAEFGRQRSFSTSSKYAFEKIAVIKGNFLDASKINLITLNGKVEPGRKRIYYYFAGGSAGLENMKHRSQLLERIENVPAGSYFVLYGAKPNTKGDLNVEILKKKFGEPRVMTFPNGSGTNSYIFNIGRSEARSLRSEARSVRSNSEMNDSRLEDGDETRFQTWMEAQMAADTERMVELARRAEPARVQAEFENEMEGLRQAVLDGSITKAAPVIFYSPDIHDALLGLVKGLRDAFQARPNALNLAIVFPSKETKGYFESVIGEVGTNIHLLEQNAESLIRLNRMIENKEWRGAVSLFFAPQFFVAGLRPELKLRAVDAPMLLQQTVMPAVPKLIRYFSSTLVVNAQTLAAGLPEFAVHMRYEAETGWTLLDSILETLAILPRTFQISA